MEIILRQLTKEALYGRPGDEKTQNYASILWPIMDPEGPKVIAYNRDRQGFEKIDFEQFLGSWFQDRVNSQPMKDVLRDARTIKGRYGLSVGTWYAWEHAKNKLGHRITSAAEFIYFKVPYSYNIPGLEKLAGWGELE